MNTTTASSPDSSSSPAPAAAPAPVLRGQPALVTGASSGIGRAVSLALARAGADVVVNYAHDHEGAAAAVADIEACGRRAFAVQADVSREEEVEAMFARAVETFGTLHVVVCNAGLQKDAPFHEMTLDQWNTVIGKIGRAHV